MKAPQPQPFEFGPWRVDPARGVISRPEGREQRLEPKLMDLLLLFAGSGGRVLSKDEIVEAAWEGRAIGDDTLAAAISRLRRALGESAEQRFIETVPKRGYRSAIVAEPTAQRPTAAMRAGPPEAQALVEQGRRALASPFSLPQARLSFEAAVRIAPGWAPAHQGLADALVALHFAGLGESELTAAKAAANAAVGLDESSAPAWATLGMAILLADREFAAADAALRRALALDSGYAPAHRRRAFAFASVGRLVEAEREARRAVELQPTSIEVRNELLQILLLARRYRQAAAEASTAIAMAPNASDAWNARGWSLVLAGESGEGVEALMRGLELWGADKQRLRHLRALYRAEGQVALCRAAADLFGLQQMLFARRQMDVAMLRSLGGQPDEAFEALEASAARDDPVLLFFPWLPHFDALRRDPRYQAFVGRLRLVR
jgi:DNA-binding winged helix-turn-helix (wHTH) protein/Tfp pilus assembly protein PilF